MDNFSSCKLDSDHHHHSTAHASRCTNADERKSVVLVIVTGGTIAMKNENGTYVPDRSYLNKVVKSTPVLHETCFSSAENKYCSNLGEIFVLPKLSRKEKRVIYCLYEYEDFIDSCNMTMNDYKRLAEDIKKHYSHFDGFVILHGTDTMAYTASYLSFMLENLGKSVILTGAQVPLCAARSDGVDNLLGALLIAGNYIIPEVTLFFHNALYRGNRVRKIDSHSFFAFRSPNMDALVEMGVEICVYWSHVWRSVKPQKFSVRLNMEENVGLLRWFPGMTAPTMHAFLSSPMKGVVLQTYGTGNGPSNRKDLMKELKSANQRGVLMVNCTQCHIGTVTGSYQTGKALEEAGVLPGYDMTPEAALAKLSYILGMDDLAFEEKRKLLIENLRGEITVNDDDGSEIARDNAFFEAVATGMRICSNVEREELRTALYPSMLCYAAKNNAVTSLKTMISQGADVRCPDYDGRTCLHVAASEGNADAVRYLLGEGVSVYARDRFGNTPFEDAIQYQRLECIDIMEMAGAHVTLPPKTIGHELCALAYKENLLGLKAWASAGIDLTSSDKYSRNALHIAAMNNSVELVKYLLGKNVDVTAKDIFGNTPLDLAQVDAAKLLR